MTPSDIISLVTTGTTWFTVAGVVYVCSVISLQISCEIVNSCFSQRIQTVPELQDVVEKEAKKLGITKTLTATLCYGSSMSKKMLDGTYRVCVQGDDATHATVRHEVYHIYRGDCEWEGPETVQRDLWYFLVREPRAVLYETLRIKL